LIEKVIFFITNYSMEAFVDNFYQLTEPSNDGCCPLVYAKYIIDVLAPIVVFNIKNEQLVIHTSNGTELTESMYLYHMQCRFYPQLMDYLKERGETCKQMVKDFYPKKHTEASYEEVAIPLQRYFGISEDPRELISVDNRGSSVTYTREPWIKILVTQSRGCIDDNFTSLQKILRRLTTLSDKHSIDSYVRGFLGFN